MHASTILGIAALFRAAAALPANADETDELEPAPEPAITEAPILQRRADPTAPWVSVDDEGRAAKTLTPSATAIDGSTSVVDGAPHDLTASVFTETWYGKVSTSTGEPPNPSATNKHNQGAFPRCYNQDGDHKPLCAPTPSSTLFKDTTYYVTWDPDFFNKTDIDSPSNTTIDVSVRLDYLNRTATKEAPDYSSSHDFDDDDWVKLDETDPVVASQGFLPLKIKGSYLKGPRPHNITLKLMTHYGNQPVNDTTDPLPFVLDEHRKPKPEGNKIDNRDLIIALPVVLGSLIFVAIGVFCWNRKSRRIQLGNVMSRSRRGYTGRKSRRVFNRNMDQASGIRLQDRTDSPPLYEYSDHAVPEPPQRRRDSDLGSLAGSPVTPSFGGQSGSNNMFRDELRRQEEERKFNSY